MDLGRTGHAHRGSTLRPGRHPPAPDGGGDGFYAALVGGGVYLDLGEHVVLGISAYLRKDKFNRPTYQATSFWMVPLPLGRVRFVLAGYADLAGTDRAGPDLNSQPQL